MIATGLLLDVKRPTNKHFATSTAILVQKPPKGEIIWCSWQTDLFLLLDNVEVRKCIINVSGTHRLTKLIGL